MKNSTVSSSVSARFGAAARTYDPESRVQRAVAEKLAPMLPAPGPIESILEIGCGTGMFTEFLTNVFPLALIDAVDISAPMIEAAKNRIGECKRVRWRTVDARRFSPEKKFWLVASSSALHWITPVGDIMGRIAGMLEPGGSLAAALMVEGTLTELHAARSRLFPHRRAPVSLPSPELILAAIAEAGLTIGEYRIEALQEVCVSARELFRGLNRQGVTGRPSGDPDLLNRTELLKLTEYYDRQFSAPQGVVSATYRVLYVTARNEI